MTLVSGPPRTARLARWQVRLLAWSGAVLWMTGAAWLLLHHFGQREGEFGPESNPAEPWMMRVHGAAVVMALLGIGGLLVAHVWRGWGYKGQRIAGGLLAGTSVMLVLTGYGLYYANDEWGRPWISIMHWVIGLAALPVFLGHYWLARSAKPSR